MISGKVRDGFGFFPNAVETGIALPEQPELFIKDTMEYPFELYLDPQEAILSLRQPIPFRPALAAQVFQCFDSGGDYN
ncbi:hypothetical protein [Flavilitoribacter nigricans]|uniref:Uncharacterized protein n=1 Tax=Flavilitoribacter nigricans (strain ATCC 23147 / DSM 23189 / NBRC 102662 / NCIMB 1420 / SS-2) TaxID=1122177 RepID=A0A2D0N6X0_FLAN2|nr:hypothetical protein [Flavilitoribacter nigricans]PHN04282.1 hypothetical protein CRP01_22225 [Flavilitoribacter nigricans DSM 23189 = NBRC 102662]